MPSFKARIAVGVTLAIAVVFAVTAVRSGPENLLQPWRQDPAPPRLSPSPVFRHPGSGFSHPGVLVSAGKLEAVRQHVLLGEEPWAAAYQALLRNPHTTLNWRPKPRAVVECGPFSAPDLGCREEEEDAVAAYGHALKWYFSGDRAHAEKAVEILDAWSGAVQRHTGKNARLQAGWSGASFVRAAELIRYTYDGWPAERIARAERMFRKVFLPVVTSRIIDEGGNWELIMLDAAVGITVFLNDRKAFDQAVERWRKRVRAYIYLPSDGPLPRPAPGLPGDRASIVQFWFGQQTFVSGLTQETCRDFGHTAWGLSAMAHVAETAQIQRVDLYAEVSSRLTEALELHAKYELSQQTPGWLCGGTIHKGFRPSPEIAYYHYTQRAGLSLPHTKLLVESLRPESAGFFYGWETLTHAA